MQVQVLENVPANDVDDVDFVDVENEVLTVISLAGDVIDVTGDMWCIHADHNINWDRCYGLEPAIRSALRLFIRHLVVNYAPAYVAGQFTFLCPLADPNVSGVMAEEMMDDGTFRRRTFMAFNDAIAEFVADDQKRHYLGAYIRWYIWCCDVGSDGFDPDFAAELDYIILGSAPKGVAVMRQDPNTGPLHRFEYDALQDALRSIRGAALPLDHQVLTWLLLSFGCNTTNVRLLEENDLIRTDLSDGTVGYEIRIPRIKKRHAKERTEFRVRKLIPEIGALIERLIEQNRERRIEDGIEEDAFTRPLIRNSRPRRVLMNGQFAEHSYRATLGRFCYMLRRVASELNLVARRGHEDDGQRLHLTPRRLRYTFATKLVENGASPQELADALDHSDTGTVMVYFNTRSDIVRRLDKAIGRSLAPIAQAFMGTLVASESDAVRGNEKASRIRHFSETLNQLETVGNCGSFAFCGLVAPIACYTCRHFQPWVDGPHEHVFDELEARRAKKIEEGADPKWIQIHDRTMIAVAEVIIRCEAMHRGIAA